MLRARLTVHTLHFKSPAVTSRERLTEKTTYYVSIFDDSDPSTVGVGECAVFRGLSADDIPDYEERLRDYCDRIDTLDISTVPYSSMRMGLECAMLDLKGGGRHILFDTPWSRGDSSITINGLVWMGDKDQMYSRLCDKLKAGYKCVKLKVGGIDWAHEFELIEYIRRHHDRSEVEIRLDANGNFAPDVALARLEQLAAYDIHSIEQPIRQGNRAMMAELCRKSPVPIALDEELIGMYDACQQREMLQQIRPAYIILKPTLCGGISNTAQWITTAESLGIGWWVTSALESNIGLNAIAQFVSQYRLTMPQGLGTGQLYTDNIDSPLRLEGDRLYYDHQAKWQRIE